MSDDFSRARLVRLAWKASAAGRFSETALIELALALADEKHRSKLSQALPAAWLHLDAPGDAAQLRPEALVDPRPIPLEFGGIGRLDR